MALNPIVTTIIILLAAIVLGTGVVLYGLSLSSTPSVQQKPLRELSSPIVSRPTMTWHFNIKVIDENNTKKNIDSDVQTFIGCQIPDPSNPIIIPASTTFTNVISCDQENMVLFGAEPIDNKIKLDLKKTAISQNLVVNLIKLHPYDNGTWSFSTGDIPNPFDTSQVFIEYVYFKEIMN